MSPLFWNRKKNLGSPSFNPTTCSEKTEIPTTLQNPPRMHPAKLGKERLLHQLESGNGMSHPFKEKRFQPKQVTMKDGTVIYKNRLLPGSDLYYEFVNASKSYLTWMITQQCTHPRNKLQGSKCGCMIEFEGHDIETLAMLQLTFFTQEKNVVKHAFWNR